MLVELLARVPVVVDAGEIAPNVEEPDNKIINVAHSHNSTSMSKK